MRAMSSAESPTVRALLVEAALPVDDLDEAEVRFLVALRDGEVVGAIGLQPFGRAGLLRSLVVRPDARGHGTGARLVDGLERHAHAHGITALVLLTQTDEAFFAARGYRAIARGDAPAAVLESAEFRALCPASATCMEKQLEPPR